MRRRAVSRLLVRGVRSAPSPPNILYGPTLVQCSAPIGLGTEPPGPLLWSSPGAGGGGGRSEAGCARPEDGGVGAAQTVKRPPQQLTQPQYANYWAPLTCNQHILPHPAQPRHTNRWAPRTRQRHQQEHRPQRPTERSDPTQHAKGRTGDCPGPRKEAATRRSVTQGVAIRPGPAAPGVCAAHKDALSPGRSVGSQTTTYIPRPEWRI